MALSTPYQQRNYLGEHADDAAALVFIKSLQWDSTFDGTGTPQNGMFYYNTTAHDFIAYKNGGWSAVSTGGYSTDNISTPPTDAELDTAFGDPSDLTPGFIGVVDDGGAGAEATTYICWTTGTAGEWFYALGTKAT